MYFHVRTVVQINTNCFDRLLYSTIIKLIDKKDNKHDLKGNFDKKLLVHM